MKAMNLFRFVLLTAAVAGLALTGCKKDKIDDPTPDSSVIQQLSGDEETFESALDESMNDVDMYLSNGNLKSTEMLPCNATIDSTAVVNDTLTIYITYNGLNCSGTRYRTGQVEIRRPVGQHWYQQGASVRIRHINFTITRVATNKSITINSVKTHKNVSGGVIWQLGNGYDAIVHRTWGHANVLFQDGTSRTWNVARQKTFTGVPPLNLKMVIDGFGTANNYTNLVVWGTNRQSQAFYTQIVNPVLHRQVCDWDPVDGVKAHFIPSANKSATLTFGFDSNNQPVTGAACPTKYKVDWQHNNNSGTVYLWL